MITKFITILSILIAGSFVFATQSSLQKTVTTYEQKILEKEKDWRLSDKSLDDKYSRDTWVSEQGAISIMIRKFESPSKALEFLEGSKTSRASGESINIEGLGDAAYEH